MDKIHICIPTYNEAENIKELLNSLEKKLAKLSEYEFDILVIDDNSPDGTAGEVKDFKESSQLKITIIENQGKGGLGKAYLKGFRYALEDNTSAVVMMDADLSHNPSHLPSMISELIKYDFVVGSRYVKDGGVQNWDKIRKLISKYGNLYSKFILGVNISDLTGGYNCYKKEVLESINLDKIKSNGYSFQIELKYKSIKNGFKGTEVPIMFRDRRFGKSKFSGGIIFEAIFTPWKLKFGLM